MKQCDVLIIGAGAAGMTAGIYAGRAKKSVLILERLATGGQILNSTKVENYPGLISVSGKEFGELLRKQAEKFGAVFIDSEVTEIKEFDGQFEVITDDESILAKTVILANGSKERELGLLREKEFTGRGISYCATCDGALFKGKTVGVYGGGNTAGYSVLYLAGICKKVYWIFRKPEPRAEKHLIEMIKKLGNVEIKSSLTIEELEGDKKLDGVRFNDKTELPLDGLFILIGREPDNERFRGFVELDEAGYIKSSESCETTHEGVFCAGDTRAKPLNQLVTATADGAVASSEAIKYLNKGAKNV